jgi:hypothetical protein
MAQGTWRVDDEENARFQELQKPGSMLFGKVERRKKIKLEDYTGFEDLKAQFESTDNRGKTVRRQVEDYQGQGPGRIIIKGKTNTPAGIFFYPDDLDFDKAAVKSVEGWGQVFNAPATYAPFIGLRGIRAKNPNIVVPTSQSGNQFRLSGAAPNRIPVTREGMSDAANLVRYIKQSGGQGNPLLNAFNKEFPTNSNLSGGHGVSFNQALQSKEAALKTRISQFQSGVSKSRRDLNLTTTSAKTATLSMDADVPTDRVVEQFLNQISSKTAVTQYNKARRAQINPTSTHIGEEGIVPLANYALGNEFPTSIKGGQLKATIKDGFTSEALYALSRQYKEVPGSQQAIQNVLGKLALGDTTVEEDVQKLVTESINRAEKIDQDTQLKRTQVFDYNTRQGNIEKAEEILMNPDVSSEYTKRDNSIAKDLANYQAVLERGKLEYGTEGAFKHKGRFESAEAGALRSLRDRISTAPPSVLQDIIGIQALSGYKASPRGAEAKLGFKPDSKGWEIILHQHHLAFPNFEGSKLMEQRAIRENKAFGIDLQRYIAKQYDAALGSAAKNMANIPADVHNGIMHPWLRKLKLEEFWRNKLEQNPNMTPQEIFDSVDTYFETVVYPSMVMLQKWMIDSDVTKYNMKDVHIPQRLSQQANAYIQSAINATPVDFTHGGLYPIGSNRYDHNVNEYFRQVGTFNSMRVSGSELKEALETIDDFKKNYTNNPTDL